MLTSEPALVAGAAELLECALRYNSDMLPRLYLTGAFFFALAYCGSNLTEIARLFRVGPPSPTCRGPRSFKSQWIGSCQATEALILMVID